MDEKIIVPKHIFDKEYSTQWRREVQFLEDKGIAYTYAKKHYNDQHISEDYEDLQDEEFELVEILINEKKYLFDANEYKLNENEKVKVVLDGNVVSGRVTRANYYNTIGKLNERPVKLILKNDDKNNASPSSDDMDFVPLRKR